MNADAALAALMGLALACTCGLRAFLPLLVVAVLAWLEKVQLGPGFEFLGTPAAVACFATATVLEVAGDKLPTVDHALDAAHVVVKPTAATLTAASFIQEMDPLLALVLGLLVAGTTAEAVHVGKSKLRVLSSVTTGTLANPVLSLLEDVLAVTAALLAVVFPVLVLVAMVALAVWLARRLRRVWARSAT